jgi:hypothetical protein
LEQEASALLPVFSLPETGGPKCELLLPYFFYHFLGGGKNIVNIFTCTPLDWALSSPIVLTPPRRRPIRPPKNPRFLFFSADMVFCKMIAYYILGVKKKLAITDSCWHHLNNKQFSNQGVTSGWPEVHPPIQACTENLFRSALGGASVSPVEQGGFETRPILKPAFAPLNRFVIDLPFFMVWDINFVNKDTR